MTPETKVKAKLVRILKKYEVLFWSVQQGGYGGSAGVADYTCWLPNGLGFLIEVKSATGRLSKLQKLWKDKTDAYNVPYVLFNGSDESVEALISLIEKGSICRQ